MSSYIPPHARRTKDRRDAWKKEEEDKRKALANTDENFPTLGGSSMPNKSSWSGNKSFASLASEWKDLDNEKKLEEERSRVHEIRNRTIVFSHKISHYDDIEEEDSYDSTGHVPSQTNPEEDGWTTISKKIRPIREKTLEELEREAEDERKEREEQESMWAANQPQEYETYWDKRP